MIWHLPAADARARAARGGRSVPSLTIGLPLIPINESWCVTVWVGSLACFAPVEHVPRHGGAGLGPRALLVNHEAHFRSDRLSAAHAHGGRPTGGAGVRDRGRLCVLDLWYGVDAVRVLTYSMLLVRRERLGYARTPSCTCRAWGMGGSWQTFFFRSDRGRIESGTHKIRHLRLGCVTCNPDPVLKHISSRIQLA